MNIDAHVHILSPEFIRDVKGNMERDAHFKMLHEPPTSKFATAETLLENMEQTGIDRSVVFGFPFLDLGMCRESNDYIIDAARRYPDRLTGFAVVPPRDPGMERELIRCREAGLKGTGEIIPAAVHTDITDQGQVGRFTALCRELDFPILMHTNELVGSYYPGKGPMGPEQAYRFAVQNPDNRLIFAHWGGGLFFFEMMSERRAMRSSLRHVYYDTAASPFLFIPDVYRAARLAGVLDKVLLGSDFPLLSPARYYKEWAAAGISEEEMAAIRGGNATRLLYGQAS